MCPLFGHLNFLRLLQYGSYPQPNHKLPRRRRLLPPSLPTGYRGGLQRILHILYVLYMLCTHINSVYTYVYREYVYIYIVHIYICICTVYIYVYIDIYCIYMFIYNIAYLPGQIFECCSSFLAIQTDSQETTGAHFDFETAGAEFIRATVRCFY